MWHHRDFLQDYWLYSLYVHSIPCPGQSPHSLLPPQRSLLKVGSGVWHTESNREIQQLLSLEGVGIRDLSPSCFLGRGQLSRERTRCHKCLFPSLLLSGSQRNHCQWFSETEISQGKHKLHLGIFKGMWSEQCADSINAQVGPGNHSSEAGAWFLP